MFTLAFWKAAAERAGKTAGQAGILAIGADRLNVLALDWATLFGFIAGGAVLSVFTSLASAKVGEAGPSIGGETLTSKVAAVESGPELVAGPASDVTEGAPVDVTPAQTDYLGKAGL